MSSPAGHVPCSHCGLEVPADLRRPGEKLQFCCGGCETVYQVIHGEGLEAFYDVRERTGDARPARTSDRSYSDFDDPTFQETWCRPLPGGRMQTEFYLENVHCAACVWLVEKVPLRIPGVEECLLDIRRSRARVTWRPAEQNLAGIAAFLDRLGYPAHPWRGSAVEEARRQEDRRLLIRIAIAGAAAGNVMLIAFSLYGGHFSGMSDSFRVYFRWISLLFTLPAVAWSGLEFYRGAWASLRARSLHMDLPITIGVLAGFLWGSWNTIRGSGEIYFDTLTVLIFLLLCGRWLVRRQQRRSADATELLYSLTPSSARRIEEGRVREVPLETLQEGDLVELRSGDTIPADGHVEEGEGQIDTSLLTGESLPRSVSPGDPVFAGTINRDARLVVKIARSGAETRVGRLMQEIEAAASRRAPVVQLADRISGWFVLTVLGLSGLTFALWIHAGVSQAIDHAISLLIVTCPCALGMATPLAVAVALGRAARQGILVRGADVVEGLEKGGVLVLDKTGTLTEGRYGLVMQQGEEGVLSRVAAIEAQSSHAVARALCDAAPKDSTTAATEVENLPGNGMRGRVEGRELLVGSPAFLREAGYTPDAAQQAFLEEILRKGLTPVLAAGEGRVQGLFGLGDRLRPRMKETLDELRGLGWKPRIYSGDHTEVAVAVGAQLDLPLEECHGGMSPEDKLQQVELLAREGTVAMVGDGVNDAAALAAADIGISVSGGAEASLAAADVYLSREGLAQLPELLRGARGTMRTIRLNLVFSLLYNTIGASLALAGILNPIFAAVLMPLSSLTVVFLSLRGKGFRPA